jgi:triacylglycerol lipase
MIPEQGIMTMNFKQRSLLFAQISQIAYLNKAKATKQAKKIGFTTVEYYDVKGAQSYRFMNKRDLVIACRGTEPTQYADIKADANALPVIAETVSRVHKGFKDQVDELWPAIREDLTRTQNQNKDVWFTGHSLGAAMATIMASRCMFFDLVPNPEELYTYGSPRVGWTGYVNSLGITHHRWKNNNDIVTTVPLAIMGFKHHGTMHYLNSYGNVRRPTGWQMIKDRLRGMWTGIKQGQVDNFSDHLIHNYIDHLQNYKDGKENPQK